MEHSIINDQTFLQLLQELHQSGAPAALFVEEAGLGNESGIIKGITAQNGDYMIEMDRNRSFSLSHIMAVNGTFRTGFSTC